MEKGLAVVIVGTHLVTDLAYWDISPVSGHDLMCIFAKEKIKECDNEQIDYIMCRRFGVNAGQPDIYPVLNHALADAVIHLKDDWGYDTCVLFNPEEGWDARKVHKIL